MSFQCYYESLSGERCKNEQEGYWCSEQHEKAWKETTYGIKTREDRKRMSIEDIQKRLKEMGKETHFKCNSNGQRRIADDEKELGVVLNH